MRDGIEKGIDKMRIGAREEWMELGWIGDQLIDLTC